MKKGDRRKVDAFEFWCWRRLLNIRWFDKRKNSDILNSIGNPIPLSGILLKNKMQYFGHVIRADGMEKQLMLGITGGQNRRGRPRLRWIDDIKEATSYMLKDLIRKSEDRSSWRALCWEVARSRARLGSTRQDIDFKK